MAISEETARRAVGRAFPEGDVQSLAVLSRSRRNALFEVELDGERAPFVLKVCGETRNPDRFGAEPAVQRFVRARTPVPTPEVVAVDLSERHVPRPFFLMQYVDGRTYERRYKYLPAEVRRRFVRSVGGMLAALHGSVRFATFGRPERSESGLRVRPAAGGWHGMVCRLFDQKCASLQGTRFEDFVDEIAALKPDSELFDGVQRPTLLHRDVRPGNFLVDGEEVQSLLDWEHALVGDGEFDLVQAETNLTARFRTPRIRRTLRSEFYERYLDEGALADGFAERSEYYRLCSLMEILGAFEVWAAPLGRRERERNAAHFRQRLNETIRRIRGERARATVESVTET